MLPVSSATTYCYTHSQINFHGGLRSFCLYSRPADVRCSLVDSVLPDLLNGIHQGGFLRTEPTKALYSTFMDHTSLSGSLGAIKQSFVMEEGSNQLNSLSTYRSYLITGIDEGNFQFVENSIVGEEKLMDFTNQITDAVSILPEPAYQDSTMAFDAIQSDPSFSSDAMNMGPNSASSVQERAVNIVNETNKSISDLLNKGENVLNSSIDTITSSIKSALQEANEALNNVNSGLTSALDRTGELASNQLIGFSKDLKEASAKLGITAVDLLRNTIVVVEDSLGKGFTSAVYSYDSIKEFLSPEIRDAINVSESKLAEVLRPVKPVFEQAYSSLQKLEGNLGLDANDPLITFVLFLGGSVTL